MRRQLRGEEALPSTHKRPPILPPSKYKKQRRSGSEGAYEQRDNPLKYRLHFFLSLQLLQLVRLLLLFWMVTIGRSLLRFLPLFPPAFLLLLLQLQLLRGGKQYAYEDF